MIIPAILGVKFMQSLSHVADGLGQFLEYLGLDLAPLRRKSNVLFLQLVALFRVLTSSSLHLHLKSRCKMELAGRFQGRVLGYQSRIEKMMNPQKHYR